jgi:hypothetical protein
VHHRVERAATILEHDGAELAHFRVAHRGGHTAIGDDAGREQCFDTGTS